MRTKLFVCLVAIALSGCIINFKPPVPQQDLIHVDAHYVYPGKNEFNSSERFYKKEIDIGNFAETRLDLDPGQQLLVLNKAIVLHFYQMPDTFYHTGIGAVGQPHFLRIWADTLDKTVRWYGSAVDLQPAKYNLRLLIEYVDSIVKSTDDYQSLPKSKLTGD
jgi:hypothetical protein